MYSDELYNGLISAKQFWFYGSMALLMLAFGIYLLFNRKGLTFNLNIIDISLIMFYVYFFIRARLTPYTPLIYNAHFLNYSLLLIFYFVVKSIVSNPDLNNDINSIVDVKKKREVISTTEILILVLISTGLVQAIWGLLQLYGFTRSFHSGFKITGTFFNPAPYALYLAAVFPLALGRILLIPSFLHYIMPSFLIRKISYYISTLTVIIIILVLPATMNRASWLGVAAGSLMVFNYRYDLLRKAKTFLHSTTRKLYAIAIVILVIGISGAGLYFLKKGSSDGRLLIWQVTMGKIGEKPLFGHGVGRFEAEYNNWQADYFNTHKNEMEGPKGMAAGNTKYCFNEYLEVASEIGIIGLILFLAIIVSLFSKKAKFQDERPQDFQTARLQDIAQRSDLRAQGKINDYQNSFIPSLLIPSLVSLLVCALISFPFYSLVTNIVFFLLLALLSSCVKRIPISERFTGSSIIRGITKASTSLIFISVSVLLIFVTKQQYKSYHTLDEAVMLYQSGSYCEACKSFSEIYVPFQYSGFYLQYYGKSLNLKEDYSQSIETLERSAHFTSDEILYTTIGDTYKALKRYSEAEEAYLHASFMVPHKLYPLYLLANLYSETGQKEKAIKTAEKVLNKNIKVESTATKEIFNAMKELIMKLNKQ